MHYSGVSIAAGIGLSLICRGSDTAYLRLLFGVEEGLRVVHRHPNARALFVCEPQSMQYLRDVLWLGVRRVGVVSHLHFWFEFSLSS